MFIVIVSNSIILYSFILCIVYAYYKMYDR